jgi:NADPH:quinone reductase-like Zn-dependent oxidoreductase
MRAAVINHRGEMPRYVENFPEPKIQHDDEVLVSVKAAAIKHVDKSRAAGKHYSATDDISQAQVIGGDCVGILENGRRVFALGVSGTIAEKATIDKRTIIPIPDAVGNSVAAALPNAVAGSAMALRFKAGIKNGETVLINGATGFTGKIAVQLAKYYGAGKVIAMGRSQPALQSLRALGADEIISLAQADDAIVAQIKTLHESSPIDIMIDYLWGHTAELLLTSLKGRGSVTHQTRFVSVGAMTGDTLSLSAENLRSVDLHLSGSGLGSWKEDEMQKLFTEILPDTFQLAASGKLQVDTQDVPLADIGKLWEMEIAGGKRLVVTL